MGEYRNISGAEGKPPSLRKKTRKNPWGCLIAILAIILFVGILGTIYTTIIRYNDSKYNDDPYRLANEKYLGAFEDFINGDSEKAKAGFLKAIELQKLPPDEIARGKPRVYPNYITYNSYYFLATLSVQQNDCPKYWYYRKEAEQIAVQEWVYIILEQTTRQGADMAAALNKEDRVKRNNADLRRLEAKCPAGGADKTPSGAAPAESEHNAPPAAGPEKKQETKTRKHKKKREITETH